MDCAFGAVCVQLTKAAAQPSAHPITALVVFPVTLLTLLLLRRSSHKVQAILQCYRLGFRTTEPAVNCILLMPIGGPSQLDPFDRKPDAPAEIRGPYILTWLKRLHRAPSKFAEDATFLHRAWLDAAGILPPPKRWNAPADVAARAAKIRRPRWRFGIGA